MFALLSNNSVVNMKILLTGVGCPGASALIKMLKNNGERTVKIVGVDMDNEAAGRFFVDKFYKVPPGGSKDYIPFMVDLVAKEKPDILFPELTYEVYPLASNKQLFEELGTKVLVSEPEAIRIANNKYLMYEALNGKISLPKYFSVNSYEGFMNAAGELGYPEKPIVFKPHVGKGSRGVRIIDPKIDHKKHILETKPTSKYMSIAVFSEIFKDAVDFPELLVMEYLDEKNKGQRTADSLCMEGRALFTTIKTVEQTRCGVIVKGELIKDTNLVEQTHKILKAISLSYCVNLQFIAGKLIEINPRVSSFVYQKDLNPPYLAVKLALGELNEEDLITYSEKIDYGLRMVRYMDQVSHRFSIEVKE